MAYCKRCACGFINLYEKMGGAPLRCTKCSRFIAAVTEEVYTQPEETAQEQPVQEEPQVAEPISEDTPEPERSIEMGAPKSFLITLESPDGSFVLPITEAVTVGRNAALMEYLGLYPDVSREHFTIAPRANGISATVTDKSSWGTYINGVRLIKGAAVAVSNLSEIRLATRACLLVRVKEVTLDA